MAKTCIKSLIEIKVNQIFVSTKHSGKKTKKKLLRKMTTAQEKKIGKRRRQAGQGKHVTVHMQWPPSQSVCWKSWVATPKCLPLTSGYHCVKCMAPWYIRTANRKVTGGIATRSCRSCSVKRSCFIPGWKASKWKRICMTWEVLH